MLNIQGLISKRTNKLHLQEVKQIFETHDIVLFTETWSDKLSDLNFENFECFSVHREKIKPGSKRLSGGIAIYVRNKRMLMQGINVAGKDCIDLFMYS